MNRPLTAMNIQAMETLSISRTRPLDEVTVHSLTETEQSSSCDIYSDISSVDSSPDDEEERLQQPRSIFSSYWSDRCRIGLQRQPVAPTDVNDTDANASAITYERALQSYEETRPERFTVLQSTMSLEEMAMATRPKPIVRRKPWSDSILERRAPSCLRPRAQRRSTSAMSVRFSESIEVVEFTTPNATWAPKGWSDYFF